MSPISYKPYVPPEQSMKEISFKAIFLGIIMAVILGAANAYLGLMAGMTVAATFPAAVISMAVLRPFKGTILEENLARTTGAVGEALAAGAIFTIPAFLMTGVWTKFDVVKSSLLMLVGGVLGVFLIILVRRTLVEDAELPFPESVACAEMVKTGQKAGSHASFMFWAMGLGGFIEFFTSDNGIKLIKPFVRTVFRIPGLSRITYLNSDNAEIYKSPPIEGRMFIESPAANAALTGVGYIIGPKLAALTFSGGVLGWLFLMPILLFVSGELKAIVTQGAGTWTEIAISAYNAQVKPIAVGAMLVGAFYTLYKMRKSLAAGISRSVSDVKKAQAGSEATTLRTDKDLPFPTVIVAIIALVIPMIFLYNVFTHNFGSSLVAALVMLVMGLLFAAVAGYLVGIIGSSSNPISGLTLTTLLIAALMMVIMGQRGNEGIAAVLGVAAVVCCVAGVAGDMIQDWKVGHILGGTPWKMQVGGIIGVIAAALTLTFSLQLLQNNVPGGIGGEILPAPQAGLMATMAKGIVGGEMAWPLVIAGMLLAVVLILIGSPSPMLIAVGMYLPFRSTACIFFGGVVKYILESQAKKKKPTEKGKEILENIGLLLASGLIAGQALMGIITAALRGANLHLPASLNNPWLGLVIFFVLGFILIYFPYKKMIAAGEYENK
ncbi:oligopeptide transporter, OPT family [Candidatus Aminicenantes bacterium AC-334-K16]|jgi:OPT family oligopeptide transporter|nr:oligopeptide transporter, OPT family [Candidatus Aminicenantes bacterium AC-334-K16]